MFAAERYLKVRLDEAARNTLDTAMRNGADWVIREGWLPAPKEVLEHAHRAAANAVTRWQLDRANRDIAEARAQAVIARALQAAHAPSGREQQGTRPTAQ